MFLVTCLHAVYYMVLLSKYTYIYICYRYIFSLALADLLVIITCVPFTSILYTVESWPWGVVVCKVSETAKDISIGVSVFTLTALSAERYCAIVNPLRRLQVGINHPPKKLPKIIHQLNKFLYYIHTHQMKSKIE